MKPKLTPAQQQQHLQTDKLGKRFKQLYFKAIRMIRRMEEARKKLQRAEKRLEKMMESGTRGPENVANRHENTTNKGGKS